MKKAILFIITFLISSLAITAQTLVENAFQAMPENFCLNLSKSIRQQLLVEKTSSNKFGGLITLEENNPNKNYLRIRTSENATLQLRVFKSNENPFVIMALTACAPVCSSHTGFFDSTWKDLTSRPIEDISLLNFIDEEKLKTNNQTLQWLLARIDIPFIEFNLLPDFGDIQITLNSKKYLDEELYQSILPYLKANKLTYQWNGNQFQLLKAEFISE